MAKKNKYMIVYASSEKIAAPHVVLFDEWLYHEGFANRNVDIRSAGFFTVKWENGDFNVHCFGHSTELKKDPLPSDEKLIKNFLLR
jgi:ectoine hydroxylase-related dioxygenase (phytanoyl-CoA dioxygenase family)